ncbi:uncharacterized protein LOC142884506 [Nelusetta ayraudi]|uniref:uncharacterized protein LOC142884506 n=1 Tax=Nelusetta ayraudi TaxID=303726 RepID=UPI003F6FA163
MAALHTALASHPDVSSVKTCSVVRCPLDNVKTTSRHLDSSQERQDNAANESDEGESDSGDSVFITQRAVPEAVRSGRRLSPHQRSYHMSPSCLLENDTSSSDSNIESNTKIRRVKKKLPKYSFPFLCGQKWKPRSSLIAREHNESLHRSAMLGFFRCARELQENYSASPPPTSDMDGTDINPLSEEEEKGSGDEDIKVVERKCFLVGVKAKSSKTWWNQAKEPRNGQVVKSRQQKESKTLCGISAKLRTLDIPKDTETLQPQEDNLSKDPEGHRVNKKHRRKRRPMTAMLLFVSHLRKRVYPHQTAEEKLQKVQRRFSSKRILIQQRLLIL